MLTVAHDYDLDSTEHLRGPLISCLECRETHAALLTGTRGRVDLTCPECLTDLVEGV